MRKPTNLTLDPNLVADAKRFLGCDKHHTGDKRNGRSLSDLVSYLMEVHLTENKRRRVRPDAARPFGLAPIYE